MTAPSIGIKDLLVAAGVGVFGNPSAAQQAAGIWGIYISKQPDGESDGSPDRAITVYDSGGLAPNPRWALDYPSIQLIVRGAPNEYQATFDKTVDIQRTLLGLPAQDLNGDRWNHINQRGNTGLIGYDSKRRPEFTMNFALIIEPALPIGSYRLPL